MHNNSLVTAVVSQQLHTGWPLDAGLTWKVAVKPEFTATMYGPFYYSHAG